MPKECIVNNNIWYETRLKFSFTNSHLIHKNTESRNQNGDAEVKLCQLPTELYQFYLIPAGIYLLKVNSINARKRSETCLKLTIKTQYC